MTEDGTNSSPRNEGSGELPNVLVVTVAFGATAGLREHLQGIADALRNCNGRHVVVDNSANQEIAGIVSSEAKSTALEELIYHPVQGNPGFGAGMNIGMQYARDAEHVFLSNPDAVPAIGSDIGEFVARHLAQENPGIALPLVTDSSRRRVYVRRALPTPANYPYWSLSNVLGDRLNWLVRIGSGSRQVRSGSGAAMLLPATVRVRLSGFDEDYFLYMEDVDLFKRAHDCGIGIRQYDSLELRHQGGASTRSFDKNRVYQQAMVARGIYFQKHYGRVGLNTYLCYLLPECVVVLLARSIKQRRLRPLSELAPMRRLAASMWTNGPVSTQDRDVRPLFDSTPPARRTQVGAGT